MTLWTPDGERPVGRDDAPSGEPTDGLPEDLADLSPEDLARLEQMQAELDQVRAQLVEAPAAVVIANHAMGIYELAAIHLTAPEPKLPEASLAIDALAQLVEGLEGRLGEAGAHPARGARAAAQRLPRGVEDRELSAMPRARAPRCTARRQRRAGGGARARRPVPLPQPRRSPAPRPASRGPAAGGLCVRPVARGRPSRCSRSPCSRPSPRGAGGRATSTVLTATGTELPDPLDAAQLARVGAPTSLTWIARDVSTERAVYERLHKKVFEDELTGLPHRSIFLDRLDLSLRRTHVGAPSVTLLVVGLDRFRDRTDRLAPGGRDELLHAVGERLDRLRGRADSVSRWGDDEFVVPVRGRHGTRRPRLPDRRRVRRALRRSPARTCSSPRRSAPPPGAPGRSAPTSCSDRQTPPCQMARQRGGGSLQRYDDAMHDRARRRAEIEDALRGAADRGELVLHYQPEVSLRTNRIVALEALVRWQHPEWGLVAPGEFVPVAEGSNLILEVGGWVLREATEQCGALAGRYGDRAPTVAVNISARQFAQDDFVELVAGALERSGAEAGDLCLEITESVLMDDVDRTQRHARRAEGPRRAARRRRLRHRLLVALVPASLPRRRAEGRPVVRERPRPRRGGLGDRAGRGRTWAAPCASRRWPRASRPGTT